MRYFPAFLNIRDKKVLIVGGGTVARRKLKLVLAAGGMPQVVAPEIQPEIAEQVKAAGGSLHTRLFSAADLNGVCMVFSATSDEKVSKEIYALATARQIPVNSVDNQQWCSFIVPALVDRDPLVVAFSSGGGAPVVARRLRQKMEADLSANYGDLVVFLEKLRQQVIESLPEERRRQFYEELLDGEVPHLVFQQRQEEAQRLAMQVLGKQVKRSVGEVWLAGAGPGGAELITLQCLRLMHLADIIFYDRLVSEDVLEMARRDAEMISVGKPGITQKEINQLLIAEAQKGRTVLRLKGGDPGIYGRLAEEIEALKSAKIAFHIVPGLTAALACAAYGGIPLTDRRFSHGVSFISLQTAAGKKSPRVLSEETRQLLKGCALGNQTLVIYMGVELIDLGVGKLLEFGMSPSLPAMVIESVGLGNQSLSRCELQALPNLVKQKNIQPPATFIIGSVCSDA